MTNIYQYFTDKLGTAPADDTLRQLPINSNTSGPPSGSADVRLHISDIEAQPTKVRFEEKSRSTVQPLVSVSSCWSHATGNCLKRSSSSRLAGWSPSRMASMMLGESRVRRRTRPR
jgi:hypothetical protein